MLFTKDFLDSKYFNCEQCARKCHVNRNLKKGFCGEDFNLRAASACLHFGEEPLITVFGGSGTIFFTGCTLRCSFCQNYQISQQGMGANLSEKDFVEMCLKLQSLGAENINLVTGSHHIPIIAKFLESAKNSGLKIPVAWNSSAYENVENLELLKDLVDIWLPDFKTVNPQMSKKLFCAQDYPEVAKNSISWMIKNFPLKIIKIKKNNEIREKIISGVIIRHLFLPGRFEDTVLALDWLKKHADKKACISLMSQYTPIPFKCNSSEMEWRKKSLESFQNRLVNKQEDSDIQDIIEAYDFDYLFYQELSYDTSWLPDFEREQPFSASLASPVWHWKSGFLC